MLRIGHNDDIDDDGDDFDDDMNDPNHKPFNQISRSKVKKRAKAKIIPFLWLTCQALEK